MATRTEHDSLGDVEVDEDKLWGAQTQRALAHFAISTETMPAELIHALALIKQVAAQINAELGELDPALAEAIQAAASEVLEGGHADQFPLRVWQSGSGTQTNMNLNEVIAHLAHQRLASGSASAPVAVHPNDHVNRGQSSNDTIPTAIHVASALGVHRQLLPALTALRGVFAAKSAQYKDLIKIGRTHLQDAVPLTLGQELSAYEAQLGQAAAHLEQALPAVCALAIGGTAVGTGLNTHPQFGERVAARLAERLGLPFVSAPNRFAAIATNDAIVGLHGALRQCAVALMKIANDIRWLGSGPRCGLGELVLPANEPGSSIMPGKVNPSQCEAMMMVCCQVMGNDTMVGFASASGNLQLNTFRPLVAHGVLQSIRLLADACRSFQAHCAEGLGANEARIRELRDRSLMLVTALAPHIGYDQASKVAQLAHAKGLTLKEAALTLGHEASLIDQWLRPEDMV